MPESSIVADPGAAGPECGSSNTADAAPASPAVGEPSPALLRQYLAAHDAPCPGCGYNLRGSQSASCPECGRGVALGLHGSSRFGGSGALVFFALLWVFLASGMNLAREARGIYSDAVAAASPQALWISMTSGGAGGPPVVVNSGGGGGQTIVWSSNGSGTPVVVQPGGAPAGGAPTVSASGSVVIRRAGGTPLALVPGGGAAAGTPSGPMWSAVTGSQWGLAGWWTGLTLAALLGLSVLLIIRARQQTLGRVGTRRLVVFAGLLFLLYGGYHVQLFAREAAAWL